MAASLRQSKKMFHTQFCMASARCGRVKLKLVPISRLTSRQFSQLHRYTRCANLQRNHHLNRITTEELKNLYCLSLVRQASTGTQPDFPGIPSAPGSSQTMTDPYAGFSTNSLSPEEIIPNLPDLNALGEPTLASLGLGGNWPPGLVRQLLEFMHVNLDLPWMAAIVSSVLVIRTGLFFVMVRQQRFLGKFEKESAEMARLRNRQAEAAQTFDALEVLKRNREFNTYTQENKTARITLYTVLPMLLQGGVMYSAFIAVRKMALLPVVSLQSGGILWFTDLTLADPYGVLSLMSCAAMLANLELGSETMAASNMPPARKWMARGLVGLVFVVTYWQPAGSVFYLFCHSSVTLVQAALLRNKRVRERLQLPERKLKIAAKKTDKNIEKGFKTALSDMTDSAKSYFEKNRDKKGLVYRRVADDEQFKKAGVGPIPKTYSYNPKAVMK